MTLPNVQVYEDGAAGNMKTNVCATRAEIETHLCASPRPKHADLEQERRGPQRRQSAPLTTNP